MARTAEHLKVPWKPIDALAVFLLSWLVLPSVMIIALRRAAGVWPLAKTVFNAIAEGHILANFGFSMLISAVALTLVYLVLRRRGGNLESLGLRRFNARKAVLYVVVITLLFIVSVPLIFALVKLLLPSFDANQAQVNSFTTPSTSSALRLSFLALVVVPPIIEEILFRGFIFPAFANRWGNVVGALLASILFGFAHLQANISVYTIVLSLLLCWMYVRLRSIIPGMALHMLNNYLAFMVIIHK